MAADPPAPPTPFPVADAIALSLLARIDFPAPAAGAPWLAADADWIARIAPALRHAGVDLAGSDTVFVRVAAVRPAAAAGAPAGDFDPALTERVADAVAGLRPPGAARPQVAVHEEWRAADTPHVEVAVYGRPRVG